MRSMRGLNIPQDVTLLYWGERRRTALVGLLNREHQVTVISSPVELAKGGRSADVLVVDLPGLIRRRIVEEVRHHYRGRLIVLLDPGDSSHDLPPDPNRTLLTRPFSVHELLAALAGSASPQSPSDPTDDPAVLPRKAQAHEATSRRGRGRMLVAHVGPWLVRSWRERRPVRVSAILVTAALAIMIAYALVQPGAGCGSACEGLAGAGLASPSTTIFPVVAGPDTTASSTTEAGPTTTDASVGPTADAASQVDGVTSSGAGIPRTTAGSSGTPSPTSPPDPTQPPPTAAPTTAPTTTRPKPSTTTTTTTTTTTIGP